MHPVAFTIGPLAVYSYPLAFLAAFVVARGALVLSGPSRGIRPRQATDLVLAAALGGVVGARLLYVATFPAPFAADPLRVLRLSSGGLVFYGGLAGGALAVWLYARAEGLRAAPLADAVALALPPAMAVGRFGCLCAGCCGGPGLTLLGVTVPPQVADAAAELVLLGVLLAVARAAHVPGTVACVWLLGYGALRFGIEYLRADPRLLAGLTQAQLVSLAVLVPAGIAGLVRLGWREAS
jgi:phosphatidylglycerol---prolipoprotein diacylglyceryl transferase